MWRTDWRVFKVCLGSVSIWTGRKSLSKLKGSLVRLRPTALNSVALPGALTPFAFWAKIGAVNKRNRIFKAQLKLNSYFAETRASQRICWHESTLGWKLVQSNLEVPACAENCTVKSLNGGAKLYATNKLLELRTQNNSDPWQTISWLLVHLSGDSRFALQPCKTIWQQKKLGQEQPDKRVGTPSTVMRINPRP